MPSLKQIARRKENFPTLKGGEGTNMIPIEEIVNCTDCSRYIRIGYDALEVDQYNIRYGKRVCDTVYNLSLIHI